MQEITDDLVQQEDQRIELAAELETGDMIADDAADGGKEIMADLKEEEHQMVAEIWMGIERAVTDMLEEVK